MRWKHAAACLPLMAGAVAGAVAGAAAAPADVDAGWVEQRVREWQPTEREKRWEGIGWTNSLAEAERLGKERGRPVFLFTLDGKMNVGRC